MEILIITSEAKDIFSAQEFAKECGHGVTIATNYEEVVKAFVNPKFQVILTSMLVPVINSLGKTTLMPYGFPLITTAMHLGIKAIGIFDAVVNDDALINMSLEFIGAVDGQVFSINDTSILYCSATGPYINSDNSELNGAKDWMEFWLMLLNGRSPTQAL